MTVVRIADLRKAGVCRDARFWFEKHGLDWRAFVRNGIEAEQLLAKDPEHPAVHRVVDAARAREARS